MAYNITELPTAEVMTMATTIANQAIGAASNTQQSQVTMTVAMSLISSILSIVLNTLNILVATNSQFKFPISNCVAIVSMSLADLMIGVSTIMRFSLSSWSRYVCRLHLILSVTGVRVSVVSLILIIVDRYVAIIYPFRHRRYATKKFCILLVLATWLLTTLANVLENATGNYFYDPNRRICDVQVSITRVVVSTTLVYFIPLTTMLAIYTHLLVVVRRMIRDIVRIHPARDYSITIQERGMSTCSTGVTGTQATDSMERQQHEQQEREESRAPHSDHMGHYKLILTFFAVTAAFTVTMIPNRIVRLISIFSGPNAVSLGVTQWCRILVMSSSWLNFFIFSVMNRNFRRTLKHIFRRRCSTSRLPGQ